ncbi:ribonuclease P protein component [Kocuria sp. LUK]|uniref:Ribonuclease P protein component n=1 Tax=Kocuria flava TaxID=446860 RepID=A0A2N4SZU1_9MICC|nr:MULTISPECIES: ribonuclease P protein component [Kocuria]MCD1144396.1 ribonuclease P protein component [Kocuria sp. LUK]PLC11501.1 ribonuclease P protein component [Kocuria flava]
MLPEQHRMRTSAQFRATTRSGARSGRRNVVVSVRATRPGDPARVGFVVSKAVGNAVRRNRVKRRLRALAQSTVRRAPYGYDVVVRALPPAAAAPWPELAADWDGAWRTASSRAGVPAAEQDPTGQEEPES